jgi:hypothetical protein
VLARLLADPPDDVEYSKNITLALSSNIHDYQMNSKAVSFTGLRVAGEGTILETVLRRYLGKAYQGRIPFFVIDTCSWLRI